MAYPLLNPSIPSMMGRASKSQPGLSPGPKTPDWCRLTEGLIRHESAAKSLTIFDLNPLAIAESRGQSPHESNQIIEAVKRTA